MQISFRIKQIQTVTITTTKSTEGQKKYQNEHIWPIRCTTLKKAQLAKSC